MLWALLVSGDVEARNEDRTTLRGRAGQESFPCSGLGFAGFPKPRPLEARRRSPECFLLRLRMARRAEGALLRWFWCCGRNWRGREGEKERGHN